MQTPPVSFEPSCTYDEALSRTAATWNIEPGYWDIWGRWHAASPEAQRSILESLGVPSGSKEELDGAIGERMWREWNRLVPPVLILSESLRPFEIPVRIPAALEDLDVGVEVRLEDGREERERRALAELPTSGAADLRATSFLQKQLSLSPPPLGYHEIRLTIEGEPNSRREQTARLIVCPERAYMPEALKAGERRAGLNVCLYGVRSERNWGCGDFTDLRALATWAGGRLGASFLALNPLHAIHNRQPYNTSPYLPNSVFYRNPIYLDIEAIEDFRRSQLAQKLRSSPRVEAEIEALRASELVEYERVSALKRVFLKLLFRSFLGEIKAGTPRARQFEQFVRDEGEMLEGYAVHCALDEWMHRRFPQVWVWPDWPEEFRDPASEATKNFAKTHWRSVLFHKYVQWQIDIQLGEAQSSARESGLSIGLFHDLALATDRCGADFWGHGRYFVSGCRVGAPPDDFSPKGQDWSFPPPHAEQHREEGYRMFAESIRRNCRHGGALRIDHVMRFFRLFWIPPGKEAFEGTYVRDRHEELVRILALESVRNEVLIVGEDLGTVDPSIREVLASYGILSYRLLYFEKDAQGRVKAPDEYPRQALVASTTHDLPTLAGFWLGRDIEARRSAGILDEASHEEQFRHRAEEKQKMLDLLVQLGLLPEWFPRSAGEVTELTGELHNAFVGFLASTPCLLMAVNQEDLTKETEQQNLPGTTNQYPNWRRKMRFSIEDFKSSRSARDFGEMFHNWLKETKRANRAD